MVQPSMPFERSHQAVARVDLEKLTLCSHAKPTLTFRNSLSLWGAGALRARSNAAGHRTPNLQRTTGSLSNETTSEARQATPEVPFGAVTRRGCSRSGTVDLSGMVLYLVLYVSHSYAGLPH